MIVTWLLQKLSEKSLGSGPAAVLTDHTTLNTWLNLPNCKAVIKNAGLTERHPNMWNWFED